MKKFLSLLLSLCLLLGALPMQVLALPGDIFPSEGAVKTVTLASYPWQHHLIRRPADGKQPSRI